MRSKVFLSPGLSRRISRSVTVTASSASFTVTPGRGFTAIQSAFVLSILKACQVNRNGMMAPMSLPGGAKIFAGSW